MANLICSFPEVTMSKSSIDMTAALADLKRRNSELDEEFIQQAKEVRLVA